MVEVQTQVRVASGVEAIVVKAADRVEPLDSECNSNDAGWFCTAITLYVQNQKKATNY